MQTMRTNLLAVAFAFAAGLAAQAPAPANPRAELAAVLAVEEQQGDLAAAERLYRERLAGAELSPAARALANARLGALLQRLGRADDAAPFLAAAGAAAAPAGAGAAQDRAREVALAEQATKLLADRSKPCDSDMVGALLWIGEPAVPAILAELAEARQSGVVTQRLADLISVLWQIGGPKAEAFLRAAAEDAMTPVWMVRGAWLVRSDSMLAVAEAFLAHPNFDVVRELTRTDGLVARMNASALLALAEQSGAQHRVFAMRLLAKRQLTTAESTRFAAAVDGGLRATDPVLGRAAADALATRALQASVAGVRLAMQHVALRSPQEWVMQLCEEPADLRPAGARDVDPVVAADLWRLAMRAAEGLASDHPCWGWLNTWIGRLAAVPGVGRIDDLFALASRGKPVWGTIAKLVDAGNAVAVLQQAPDLEMLRQTGGLSALARLDLPREAASLLLRLAAADPKAGWFFGGDDDALGKALGRAVPFQAATAAGRATTDWWNPSHGVPAVAAALASTGYSDALSPLLALLERSGGAATEYFVFYLKRGDSEAARAAARTRYEAARTGTTNPPNPKATSLLLALLALGDPWALDQIRGDEPWLEHPYAAGDDGGLPARKLPALQYAPSEAATAMSTPTPPVQPVTPLVYLLAGDAVPPHPFALAQVEAVLQRVFADRSGGGAPVQGSLYERVAPAVRDDVLRLLARYDRSTQTTSGGATVSWMRLALQRLRERDGADGWTEWLQAALASEATRYYALVELTKDEVLARLPQIELFAKGGLGATAALEALERAGRPIDVASLVASDDQDIAVWAAQRVMKGHATAPAAAMTPFLAAKSAWIRLQAAQYFGRTLDDAAVPGLLAQLRDPDEKVREAATAALQRIRFRHEQESHWTKLQAGIDARPEAALEKLLLQARRDEPKARRLFAIASLGALGKAEATPFLIEWIDDADAEVAAAAKAAVTQIHLAAKR
ncbi:MAG: hypothetical protein FJ306_04845 [Planctomycetes bacterium]|nr:hypothetical protein [Planctomycetota bacterium]